MRHNTDQVLSCSIAARHSFRLLLTFVLLTGLTLPGQVAAYESFTAQISFFQGFSLSEGMEIDPRVLTLIFNPSEKVELVLPGLEEDLFSFDFAEFYLGYDPTVHSPILVPEHVQAMAVFEGSFADVTLQTLEELDFLPEPPPVVLKENEIAVFLTGDNTYYMLGHIVQLSDWTVQFDYQEVRPYIIPEPATLLLVGIGGIGVFLGMKRRKQTC